MAERTSLSRRIEQGGSPGVAGLDPDDIAKVERLLEGGVADHVFPGASLVVLRGGLVAFARAFGRLTYAPDSPDVRLETAYDLASLTKVVVTTTLAMQLVESGQLELDRRVHAYIPAFAEDDPRRCVITVRDLLTHCSGLPPVFPGHFPAFAAAHGLSHDREQIVAAAMAMPLEYEPRTRVAYSDIGVLTLGAVVERVADARLDHLAATRVLGPLGMTATRYNPPQEMWPAIAPTEDDPWRGRVVQGEVHDECAWAMGGVSAHAGLFGTAPDLAAFGQALLDGGTLEGRSIARRETIALFTARDLQVDGSDRALGWQVASDDNSAGPDLSPTAFGHTGFTGTSLWVDPSRRLVVVLLTNRVHPRRENTRILAFRPALHSAVVRAVRS